MGDADFSGQEQLPGLPHDREQARARVGAIAARNAAVEDLIGKSTVSWAVLLRGRMVAASAVGELLDQGEWAALAAETLVTDLGRLLPIESEANPKTIGEARTLLADLQKLAGQHREATLIGALEKVPPERVSALAEQVRHFRKLQDAYRQSIVATDPHSRDVVEAVLRAADAAVLVMDTHDAQTLGAAHARLIELSAADDSLRKRSRRIAAVASTLNLDNPTLGDVDRLAVAASLASRMDRKVLAAMPPAAAMVETIRAMTEKSGKIRVAAEMLDRNFGPQWRNEPIAKLTAAARIAATAGHPHKPGVGAYARTFGITAKYRDNLASVARTRAAMAEIEASAAVRAAYPNHFHGLATNFALLLQGVEAYRKLSGVLGATPGGDDLLAGLRAPSAAVVSDALSIAGLEADVRRLGFDPRVRVGRIRHVHEERKAALEQAIADIQALPVAPDRVGPSEARRLGRLLREADATLEAFTSDDIYQAAGVHFPEELLSALEWRGRVEAYFGRTAAPRSDEGFAKLLVDTRNTLDTLSEWTSSVRGIRDKLGAEIAPSEEDPIGKISVFLDQLRQAEPILHAQVLLCEKMTDAIEAGLRDFVMTMAQAGKNPSTWPAELDHIYAALDKQAEHEATAAALAEAVTAATDIAIPLPSLEASARSGSAFDPRADGAWIIDEQQVAAE